MKTITPATKLLFKYLALPKALGGRGGVQRFFLLSQDIPFTEELYAKGEPWAIEKARLLSTGENPCAQVPVIEAITDDVEGGNSKHHLQQHKKHVMKE